MSTYLELPEFRDVRNFVLINYVSTIDLIKNKEFFDFKYIRVIILNEIERRLRKIFQDKYDQFISMLDKYNMVISGSFIIQCILEEHWYSDLDIFFDQDSPDDTTFILGNPNLKNIFNNFKSFMIQVDEGHFYRYTNNLKLKYINNYKINEHKIQIICINPSELYDISEHYRNYYDNDHRLISDYKLIEYPKDLFLSRIGNYIKEQFDFDICTSYFYVQNRIPKLVLNNLNGIITKSIKLHGDVNVYTVRERIEKYTARGFIFDKYIKPRRIHDMKKYFIVNHEISEHTYDIEIGVYNLAYEREFSNFDIGKRTMYNTIPNISDRCKHMKAYIYLNE